MNNLDSVNIIVKKCKKVCFKLIFNDKDDNFPTILFSKPYETSYM